MTLCVPDTLTVDNSERYEASIRLWPDGLSFSGYIPMEKDSFFTEAILFDSGVPVVQSLKDIFFENHSFSYSYKSFYVICASEKYTLIPDSVFSEQKKELLFSFCHQTNIEQKILTQQIKDINASLLFNIDYEVYEFMMRSLVNPQFIHSLSPLLVLWQKNSFTCYPKQTYIIVRDGSFDIVCFEHGEMLFVNSFDYETDKDIVYYIMYVCRQLGINQLEDCIHFCGNNSKCRLVMSVIAKYIKQIDYFSPSILNYQTPVGKNIFLDVVTLMECGL